MHLIRISVMSFALNFCVFRSVMLPALSKVRTLIYSSNTGIECYILSQVKYIFSFVMCLSYIQVRELRCADPPSR